MITATTTRADERNIHFLGNNEINVLVSSEDTHGEYCVLEMIIQPRGGANVLHTDQWTETFHVIDGELEWTLERDGKLVTWLARRGETIVVPPGAKHKFAGAGTAPSRILSVGPSAFEQFFRALAEAWQGPYDREKTPQAVGPVFDKFGMQLCAA
jgi:quercetin dioxygenase-like cupin family protein